MKITSYGYTDEIEVVKTKYAYNDNLAIMLVCTSGEPYGFLTVNLNDNLPEEYAYVDTNNMPNAETFIEENNLGTFAGRWAYSGYCRYPLYKFNLDSMKEA